MCMRRLVHCIREVLMFCTVDDRSYIDQLLCVVILSSFMKTIMLQAKKKISKVRSKNAYLVHIFVWTFVPSEEMCTVNVLYSE